MDKNIDFLNALINGKSREIDEIYRYNFPYVKKFILQNNGKLEDAEDIFQKALLQIAVRYKKEAFKIDTSFNAYLFKVCKNLWRTELVKSKKWVTDSGIVQLTSKERDYSIAIIEQERHELFVEKLGLISENCKKILTLFFAKVPYAEIVKNSEYNSETVVRQRVFKCKKKLIELIKKDNRFNSLKES